MDREEMMAKLKELGFDPEKLKDASDEILQEILRVHYDDESSDEDEDGDNDFEFEEVEDDGDHEDHDEQQTDEEPGDHQDAEAHGEDDGEDEAEDHAMKAAEYAEMARKHAEMAKKSRKHADEPPPDHESYSERQVERAVQNAVKRVLKPVARRLDSIEASSRKAKQQFKRSQLEKFCEQMCRDGKVEPWELDETKGEPTLVDRLLALDHTKPIFKFADGQQSLTALEAEMRAIENRPVRRSSRERIPRRGEQTFDANSKEGRRKWADETYSKFSEEFKKSGMSRDDFVTTAEKLEDDRFAEFAREWDKLAAR